MDDGLGTVDDECLAAFQEIGRHLGKCFGPFRY